MYIVENSVDSKWHYQCKGEDKNEILKFITVYAPDDVLVFKTCDAVRIIDSDTNEVIAVYPKDFVQREA